MAAPKKVDKKETKLTEPEKIFLTEEEYEKIRRVKTKEQINRILRICGLIFAFLLLTGGLFDPLFELSYFGFMADKEVHKSAWQYLYESRIFDDGMEFGDWLPKLTITFALIVGAIGVVYLIAYNVIDIINMIKNFFNVGADISKELTSTVKESITSERKKRKKFLDETDETESILMKEKPKRKKKQVDELDGFTSDELDRLLSGENIFETENSDENETSENKSLFEEE